MQNYLYDTELGNLLLIREKMIAMLDVNSKLINDFINDDSAYRNTMWSAKLKALKKMLNTVDKDDLILVATIMTEILKIEEKIAINSEKRSRQIQLDCE